MIFFKNLLLLLTIFAFFQTAQADWTKQASNTLAWLHDIYFLDEKKGWIAGSDGTFLATIDGGATWTKQKKFTDDAIRQIYFADDSNGWLLCERDTFSLGKSAPSYLLQTSDGGINWQRVEFKDSGRTRIAKIFFAKDGAGWAIGEGGVFFTAPENSADWKKSPSPVRYLMFDGIFRDAANGVIVGAGGTILFTDDAGLSWNKASLLSQTEARFSSVFFVNQRDGWTTGTNGAIFQTTNGGKLWRSQKSNVEQNLNDVFFRNTAEGWAVGDEGVILQTTTAGNVWNQVESKNRHNLEKIAFAGKKGFAVGYGGTILRYDADGRNSLLIKPPQLRKRN